MLSIILLIITQISSDSSWQAVYWENGSQVTTRSKYLYVIKSSQDIVSRLVDECARIERCEFANSCCWINPHFDYYPSYFVNYLSKLQKKLNDTLIDGCKLRLVHHICATEMQIDSVRAKQAYKLFKEIVSHDYNVRYFFQWQLDNNPEFKNNICKWSQVYKYLLKRNIVDTVDVTIIDSVLDTECSSKIPEKIDIAMDSLSRAIFWNIEMQKEIEKFEQRKIDAKPRSDWFYLNGYKVKNVNVADWSITKDEEEIPFIKITGEIKRTGGYSGYRSFTIGIYDWDYRLIKTEEFTIPIPKTSPTFFEVDVYGRISSKNVLGVRMYSAG